LKEFIWDLINSTSIILFHGTRIKPDEDTIIELFFSLLEHTFRIKCHENPKVPKLNCLHTYISNSSEFFNKSEND